MKTKEVEVVQYDEDRYIKITRFFEVASYLTQQNLWDEVKTLMLESELIGTRMILDMHLGNAVKAVLARHAKANGTLQDDELVKAVISCAIKPINDGGPRGPN